MSRTDWHNAQRHYRDLRDRLLKEGFDIVDVWEGKHLRVRVRRNGHEHTITLGSSPGSREGAVDNATRQARRATAPAVHAAPQGTA